MLTIQNVSVFFADRALFDGISFQVIAKDRIGLVGKNGAGKSTLLKVIAGLQGTDQGAVALAKETKIGYLPQEMQHHLQNTVFQEAESAFKELNQIKIELAGIEKQLETRSDYESDAYQKLLQDLCDFNEKIHLMDGYNIEEKIEKILFGLGFVRSDFDKTLSAFSGGWRMRVELAKLLLENPAVLLLDEPTNHLDIESIEWLEEFLKNYPGAIILISHDKLFLDHVTNRTIEINNGNVYDYRFPYSKYLVVRAEELERQKAAYENQQKEIEKTQVLIDKFRAKASKASFAQSLIKKLDRMDRVELDQVDKAKMNIKFQVQTQPGKIILKLTNIQKSFGEKKVLQGMDAVIERGDKIALVGKNGYGKSTLLKTIVGDLKQDLGEIELGHNVKIGYFAQNQTDLLDPEATVFETIDAIAQGEQRKNVRTLLGSFLFGGDDIQKKVKVLSGGEKGRLALCQLLLFDYNFLILDEPTNHLDIISKNILKEALKQYTGTLLVVSHDRDFLNTLSNQIYEVEAGKIKVHYQDILPFLEEKKANTIAEFEKNKTAPASKTTTVAVEKEKNQDLREEKKKKDQLEKKIKQLEEKIKQIQQEVLPILDYNDPQHKTKLQNYESLQKELTLLMEQWMD